MKTLILYYSRTGTTKKVALKLAEALQAEVEEVFDTVNRAGVLGYVTAGRSATMKKLTKIKPLTSNLADYDLVIIGTPIWAWDVSTPIRTLLSEQKDKIKQTAFFCTEGGSGDEKAFVNMAWIINKKPLAVLALLTKEVAQNNFVEKLNEFVNKIKI